MSNPYTNWYVESVREIWPETDDKLIPGWLSYRFDNKEFIKRDDLDWAYMLGHILQWLPPTALYLYYKKKVGN